MSTRGHWLEAAVAASLPSLQARGDACIQFISTPASTRRDGSFYRAQSTVDCIGAYKAMPVAFDCKVTKLASLPHKNVHAHQLQFLRAFQRARGFAGLLVAFDERGPGSFLIDVRCYDDLRDELSHRSSLPASRLEIAADRDDERCYRIKHGAGGLPVPLHLALELARADWLTSRA